ncbi:hypothetical protein BLS_002770 [Venturia inaequalis]|uniref:MYND-type domain-containing protein n=1 Tax=Venturia inaequalis TaxID=5025 RepID=A0A8H3UJD2_VENIN|nr:hypothetical protein EG327_009999 [Venturia inaequalis]KAE9975076.1 hypothetical protein BLS_002770 [Venturia inaequalis]KAE9982704.1 hypothetical protein EG328_010697 [Venturia inaequalis]RDI84233.1 hypothetical protein Vi05172_g5657 [Venturia inaequalis]
MSDTKCSVCSKEASESTPKLLTCSRCKDTKYCSKECQTSVWETHKTTCRRPNYILHFHLAPDDIQDPAVTRTLSCPSTATFDDLHEALQIAFGWANTHAYDFAVFDPDCEEETGTPDLTDFIRRLQGGTTDSDPREFLLRISAKETNPGMMMMKVDKMHEGRRKHPRTVEKVAQRTKLWQILDDAKYTGQDMEYHYDFGDGWNHEITLKGREKATDRFTCLEGTGHGVAEDVKKDGWEELKEAYRTNRPNQEQKEKRHWYEYQSSNGNPAGLGGGKEFEWDKSAVDGRLAHLRI